MNKRIEELYSEAVVHAFDQRFKPLPEGPTPLQDVINNKFAELLIKECAHIAWLNSTEDNISHIKIKDHFGIKD